MRSIDLALKDLRQVLQDWKAVAFLVAAPVLFTVVMGWMLGAGGKEESDPRLPVGVVNQETEGVASQYLLELLEASETVRLVPVAAAEAAGVDKQVSDNKLAAAVIVPADYSRRLLAGEPVAVTLLADTQTEAGLTAQSSVQASLLRLQGAVKAAQLAAQAYEQQTGFAAAAARQQFVEATLARVIEAWQMPPLSMAVTSSATVADEAPASVQPFGYAQSSPGNLVTFALAGLIGAAEIMVWERKSKTLQRLLTTSISRWEILLGHFLCMLTLIFGQCLLLMGVGQALGVNYGREPLAALLMAGAITVWIGSMGLLIGVVARSSEQVAMLSVVPMLALAGLGGAWMPLEFTSPTFQAVARFVPTSWAMQGLQNIVVRGQGLSSVLLPAGVLALFAAGFLGLAVWRFQRE